SSPPDEDTAERAPLFGGRTRSGSQDGTPPPGTEKGTPPLGRGQGASPPPVLTCLRACSRRAGRTPAADDRPALPSRPGGQWRPRRPRRLSPMRDGGGFPFGPVSATCRRAARRPPPGGPGPTG